MSKRLERVFATVQVPFEIQGDDPLLNAKAEKIFKILYSKAFFGSGKEACSLILDAFTSLAAKTSGKYNFSPIKVVIASLAKHGEDKLGCYSPLRRAIEIDPKVLESLEIGDMDDKDLMEFMSTAIHEMTHAIHIDKCNTYWGTNPSDLDLRDLQKELNCSRDEYEAALLKAASGQLPSQYKFLPFFALNLATEMKVYFFQPAELVQGNKLVLGFAEYLARIPEMYCRYGNKKTAEEINEALEKIFPLGNQFFRGFFKTQCEELRALTLPQVEEDLSTQFKSVKDLEKDDRKARKIRATTHQDTVAPPKKQVAKVVAVQKRIKSETKPTPSHPTKKAETLRRSSSSIPQEPSAKLMCLMEKVEMLMAIEPGAKRTQQLHDLFDELQIDKERVKYPIYDEIGKKAGKLKSQQREYGRVHFGADLRVLQGIVSDFLSKTSTPKQKLSVKDRPPVQKIVVVHQPASLEPSGKLQLLIQRIEALKANKPSPKRTQQLHDLFDELKIDKVKVKYAIYDEIGKKAGKIRSRQREYGRIHFADSLSALQSILRVFLTKGTDSRPTVARLRLDQRQVVARRPFFSTYQFSSTQQKTQKLFK